MPLTGFVDARRVRLIRQIVHKSVETFEAYATVLSLLKQRRRWEAELLKVQEALAAAAARRTEAASRHDAALRSVRTRFMGLQIQMRPLAPDEAPAAPITTRQGSRGGDSTNLIVRFYEEKGWNYESSFASGKSTHTIEFKCDALTIKFRAIAVRSEAQQVCTGVPVSLSFDDQVYQLSALCLNMWAVVYRTIPEPNRQEVMDFCARVNSGLLFGAFILGMRPSFGPV
jgi:hypothetical protein